MSKSDDPQFPTFAAVYPAAKENAKKANPMAYRVVSVRLREAEYFSFMEQIHQFGLSGNMAMRIAARRISGFLEVDEETRQSLQSVTEAIGEIATSISAISRAAAKNDNVDIARLTEIRAGFGREFARLDAQLQAILNVSQRRQDGQKLLTEAAK